MAQPKGLIVDATVVLVLAHELDEAIAATVLAIARELHLEATRCTIHNALDPRRSLIMPLSFEALADEAFIEVATTAAGAPYPTVPVLVDPIPASALPAAIARHNWLDISAMDDRSGAQELRRVMSSDPQTFLELQHISAQADRWRRLGEAPDTLISNVAAARAADALRKRVDANPSLRQPPAISAFIRASLSNALRFRRKRRLALARRLVAALAIVAVFVVARQFTNHVNRQQLASIQSYSTVRLNVDPDYYTFRSIEDAIAIGWDERTTQAVLRGLQRPWPTAVITGNLDGDWLGEGHFDADGRYWTLVQGSGIVRWDISGSEPEVTYPVGAGPSTFAVAPDGSRLVVSTEQGTSLFTTADSTVTPLAATLDTYSALALDATTGVGTATVRDGVTLVTFDARTGATLATTDPFDAVLDIAVTDAGVLALVRDGPRLSLVDPVNGTAVVSQPAPGATLADVGAIAPSGTGFAVSIDGVVSVATRDALTPAGYVTRDVPVLTVLASGQLVVASEQDGVHVVDRNLHVDLGRICTETVDVGQLQVSGSSVACGNGFAAEVWDVTTLLPSAARPAGANWSTGADATGGNATVRLGPESEVLLTVAGEEHTFDLSDVAPAAVGAPVVAAVASSGRGLAVGTSDGWVLEFDVTPGTGTGVTLLQQWRVPTGDAVAAVGWDSDGSTLAVHAADVWWGPRALLGASEPTVAVAQAVARQAPCWIAANLTSFDEAFQHHMGMSTCGAIPKAAG